jgi:anti-anti-sigma factor
LKETEYRGRRMAIQQQTNEISFDTRNGVTVLDIRGDITAFSEATLNEAYRNVTGQGVVRLLLKMASDAYINSGGIAVLIQILAQTKRNRQLIGITGVSDHFKKIFAMVGITKFATIYPTFEEALAKMAAAAV